MGKGETVEEKQKFSRNMYKKLMLRDFYNHGITEMVDIYSKELALLRVFKHSLTKVVEELSKLKL